MVATTPEIIYPSSDGEPLAETQEHVWAILTVVTTLTQYLGDRAVIFANNFFYYVEGKPSARVAPDVMVVFGITPGMRPNYKIWQEGETPGVIFEMTSPSTRENDLYFKKSLYEQLGIPEYWLFDPHGAWIPEQLRGFSLNEEGIYRPVSCNQSQVLQLRLEPEGQLLSFYRLDNDQKLLTPDELLKLANQAQVRADQEKARADQEKARADQEKARADQLAAQLRSLGIEV